VATEIAERSEQLAHDLRVFGLDTSAYPRPPLDVELFVINIEAKQIRPWVGAAITQVAGDRRRRQAVVSVTEGARNVTRSYAIRKGGNEQLFRSRLLDSFPLFIPGARLVDYTIERERRHLADVVATVQAPKATHSLLMGFDEIRQFIAALPKRAYSVDEAQRLLRPDGLSRYAVRQGEWFFDPVLTPGERSYLERHGEQAIANMPLESGSSHRATVLVIRQVEGNPKYAIGTVTDGRVKHHRALVLNGWHRVVRNAEIIVPSRGPQQRGLGWD
jgi:hypothetical protein